MYTVLIVDDERESREGLANYFPWEDHGYRVKGTFANGADALSALKTSHADVVFSDIRMPEMDGLELAMAVRSLGIDLVFVILSAYRDFSYAQQAITHGVWRYLVKPTRHRELADLLLEISVHLDGPRRDQEKPDGIADDGTYQERAIRSLKRYIAGNLATVSLESAAAYLNMNPSYLSRFFKEQTGMLFSDYLLETRMVRARELLKSHRVKVYEVSAQVGYANSKNFARSFRSYFGKTPREYRA